MGSVEKEVTPPPDPMQLLMQNMIKKMDSLTKKIEENQSSIEKMREENKGIKESQDSLKDSLT